jgi:hypothetical protein
MKRINFLMTTVMSTLLLSSTISAQTMKCKDGKCYIDVSKLSQPKSAESKISTFKNLNKLHFTTEVHNNTSEDTIVLDPSKYIMNEGEKENYLLHNTALYNAEDTIVLMHSKYVMTDIEKEKYYMNERLKRVELEREVIVPTITIEDKISEEIILPHSELYCDSSKQAKFYPESNEYECV